MSWTYDGIRPNNEGFQFCNGIMIAGSIKLVEQPVQPVKNIYNVLISLPRIIHSCRIKCS